MTRAAGGLKPQGAASACPLPSSAQAAALLRRVLYWTSGHPYLTQRILSHVTGLDAAPILLEIARRLAGQDSLGKQVSFKKGDWNQIPYRSGTFDWVWSADAAGYAARHQPTG